MEISYLFESIRTPFLNKFFLFFTEFGGESLTYIFLFITVWCMDSTFGKYFALVNFYSLGTNVLLKNIFCIPRPWVKDPNFTAVEEAIPEATGYSFPSGHTANAVSIFGSFATCFKKLVIKLPLIILIILVAISRIYLGVHTIWDVSVSLIICTLIIFGLKVYLKYSKSKDKFLNLTIYACIYSVLVVLILYLLPQSDNYDSSLSFHGLKNAYTFMGLSFGYLLSYIIGINYDTKARFPIQIIKVLFGAIFILLIKEGSKYLFNLILPDVAFTSAIRYFIVAFCSLSIWPKSFNWFNNIDQKIRSFQKCKKLM